MMTNYSLYTIPIYWFITLYPHAHAVSHLVSTYTYLLADRTTNA